MCAKYSQGGVFVPGDGVVSVTDAATSMARKAKDLGAFICCVICVSFTCNGVWLPVFVSRCADLRRNTCAARVHEKRRGEQRRDRQRRNQMPALRQRGRNGASLKLLRQSDLCRTRCERERCCSGLATSVRSATSPSGFLCTRASTSTSSPTPLTGSTA